MDLWGSGLDQTTDGLSGLRFWRGVLQVESLTGMEGWREGRVWGELLLPPLADWTRFLDSSGTDMLVLAVFST